jgi:hypothetical protein
LSKPTFTFTVDRQCDYPTITITTKNKNQALVCLGDMHVGSEEFDAKPFGRAMQWIEDNDAIVFGLGDWIENATKHSPGTSVWRQVMTPQEQIDYLIKLVQPIKHRIVAAVQGNHEERTERDTGIDPMAVLCHALSIEYFRYEIYARIRADRDEAGKGCEYTMYGIHSTSVSGSTGLSENKIERDWEKFLHFDLLAKGHGHNMSLSDPKLYLQFSNGKIVERERRFWHIGHYLSRPGSYNAKVPRRPLPTGTMAVWLKMAGGRQISGEEIR